MAYEKKEIEELALKAIKKHRIVFVTYVSAYLPCSNSTFYDLGLEKSELIKEALFENKVKKKAKLLDKWEESENATLNIAVFKLTDDN